MDYGKILLRSTPNEIMTNLTIYEVEGERIEAIRAAIAQAEDKVYHPELYKNRLRFSSFLPAESVAAFLANAGCSPSKFDSRRPTDLEDAFIALTGEY